MSPGVVIPSKVMSAVWRGEPDFLCGGLSVDDKDAAVFERDFDDAAVNVKVGACFVQQVFNLREQGVALLKIFVFVHGCLLLPGDIPVAGGQY